MLSHIYFQGIQMKKLIKPQPLPNKAYIDVLKAIIKSKQNAGVKGKLNSKIKEIEMRYQNLELLVEINDIDSIREDERFVAIKNDLNNCYLSKPAGLIKAIEYIKEQQPKLLRSRCPYCGTTLPNTIDHYLPKEVFPEYSVHMLNLIPCCSTCNSKKKERWVSQSHRLFLYLYSDYIPEEQYLFINLDHKIGTKALTGKFYINKLENMTDEVEHIWEIIASHYKELDLLNRFQNLLSDEIEEIIINCADHLRDGGDSAEGFLKKQINSKKNIFGINHWRIVLWEALVKDSFFLELVTKEAGCCS